jgi:hypothetical protein
MLGAGRPRPQQLPSVGVCGFPNFPTETGGLFAWLISHQPAVLFSQNKPATSNQPKVLFSRNKSAPAISHRPNEHAVGAVCGASPDEKNDVTCVLHSGQRSLTFGFAWDVAAPCTSRRGMYCTVGCKKERVNDTLVEGGKSIFGKRNGRIG